MMSKMLNKKSFFIIFSFWISNKQNETRTTKLRFFPLNDVVQRLRHTHICICADCTDVSCRCELPANSRTVIGSSPQQPSLQRPLVSRGVWCFPVQLKWSRLGSAWRDLFIQSGLFFSDFWPFCLSFSLHVPLVSVFTWSRLVLMFRYVGRVPTCPRLSSNHLRVHLLACTSDICMALGVNTPRAALCSCCSSFTLSVSDSEPEALLVIGQVQTCWTFKGKTYF